MRHITCSLKPSFAHENCLIFAGIGSGLHCYQFLIFTYAYALIFIHRCFGSLFWLLGVLIRSLFHKKVVLIGSLSRRLGVLISFGGSGIGNIVCNAKPTEFFNLTFLAISCSQGRRAGRLTPFSASDC